MWTLLARRPGFRRLWAAATVDAVGTWLLVMAVPVQVYALTGSATSTAVALAVQAAPTLVVGPWAGALVDRWSRRSVFVVANGVAALGVGLIAAGPVRLIYAGLVVECAAACFLRPALQATVPAVVTDRADRASANALLAVSHSVLRICAPLAGTALTAAGWFTAVVAVDAASYLGAALLLARLPLAAGPGRPATATRPPTGSPVAAGVRAGLRFVFHSPVLRGMLAGSFVYWVANAALTALLVPFAVGRLHGDGRTVGHLVAGLGVGFLGGSLLSRSLVVRWPARTVLTTSYATVGALFLVLFTTTSTVVALVSITVAGVPGAVATVATAHHVQTASPAGAVGRVASAFQVSDAAAAVAGALAAPALVVLIGAAAAPIVVSALVLVAAVVTAVQLRVVGSAGGGAQDRRTGGAVV
ncbi:MFS transporter [Paractinoplanes maris]|uniref:MFS transporter n=1 Tax=Paractinoplanes maris TaxID=1734446 RepID=UPI002021CED9|nr:MFS transporter [Actinoplanes maris]